MNFLLFDAQKRKFKVFNNIFEIIKFRKQFHDVKIKYKILSNLLKLLKLFRDLEFLYVIPKFRGKNITAFCNFLCNPEIL